MPGFVGRDHGEVPDNAASIGTPAVPSQCMRAQRTTRCVRKLRSPTASSGAGVAAVQTSFDGVVYFSANLERKQRTEVAIVCVAVLLREE